MAKLTARFDMEDKMSKKLKNMHGNLEKIEKTRDQINKPMVLEAKDKASKQVNKVNDAVEKVVGQKEIVLNAKDKATKQVNNVKKATEKIVDQKTITMQIADKITKPIGQLNKYIQRKFPKTHRLLVSVNDRASSRLNSINNFVKRRMPRTHNLIVRAQDRAKTVLEKINTYANRYLTKARMITIMAKDKAMPTMHKIANYGKRALAKGYNFSVRAIDIATKTVGRIAAFTRTALPAYRDFTIRAINGASRVIGSIKRALFSIPSIITVTLAVVGINKLSEATVGSAMNFEGYGVSMEHWLDGNTKESDKLVKWMGEYADKTPFSSPDLFPALARGVGLADGDIKQSKKLLEVASNMAALTPGRTVEDAMEALGNAQMGEFTNLKSFNVKMTKDIYDAAGGWTGFIDDVDKKFLGGAQKLSETSEGIIATLKGYQGSMLRSLGQGILDPMKPRLESINKWLENNQDKWAEWKGAVQKAGEDASEWVFSKLEKGFSYIKTNYLENDDFKKLDFEGKVKFIMDDLGKWWDKTGRPLLVEVSKDVGEAIFKGVTWGIKEGIKGIGSMWKDALKDPSLDSFGSAGLATMLGISVASLLVSPLIKAFKIGGTIIKKAWDIGKWGAGLFGGKGKGKGPKGGPIPGDTRMSRRSRTKGTPKSPKTPKPNKPDYRQPWFNKGDKPILNTPNKRSKVPKIPKGLGGSLKGIAKFGKRLPVLGPAIGALSIATSSKEDMPGTIGAVGGGLGGAATGGAIGTAIFPGIGTAIGGILGGLAGSLGGTALGDWFGDNWDTIKQGATDTGAWIGDKFSSITEGIGETLFSGDWWSEKWGQVKELTTGTIFDGDWWSEKWSGIKEMTEGTIFDGSWWSEKWNGITETLSETIFSGEWWGEKWNGIKELTTSTIFSASWWFEQAGFIWGYLEETLFSAEWWGNKWDSVKEWTTEKIKPIAGAFLYVKDKISETIFSSEWWGEKWEGIKELTKGTIFDGAWWSEEWDGIKEMTAGTIFDGAWWSDKWDSVKEWTADKWEGAQEIWNNVKTAISETILSGEWWKGKWDDVKGWASDKWAGVQEVWDNVKTAIKDTIFNGEWWKGKWDGVKGWTQEKWDGAKEIWTSVKNKFSDTVFSGEWWKGKWDTVIGWTSDKWDGAKEIWENVKTGLGETLFDKDWWSGRWNDALEAGKSILGGIGGWVSGLIEDTKESFNAGREKGKKAASSNPAPTAGKSSSGSNRKVNAPGYANGGMIDRPHLGLVGEAGPEMIIPLSPGRRGRAMDLYNRTGEMLGVHPYANGGMAGNTSSISTRYNSNNDSISSEKAFIQLQGINNSINNVPLKLGDSTKTITNSLFEIKDVIGNGILSFGESINTNTASLKDRMSSYAGKANDKIAGLKSHVSFSTEKLSNKISGLNDSLSSKISKIDKKAEKALKVASNSNSSAGSGNNSLQSTIDSLIKNRGQSAKKYFSAIEEDGDWLNDWSHTGNNKADKPYLLAGYEYSKQLGHNPDSGSGLKHLNRIKGYAKGTNGPLNRSELALVGERGPELVGLPKGAEVFTNQESKKMATEGSKVGDVERQGKMIGMSFSESVGEGINNKVISLEDWKNQNIQEPMQNVVDQAVGFGSGTVRSFSAGQNETPTYTNNHLNNQVKHPFEVIKGSAPEWGAGTISGFRSGQNSVPTNTNEFLNNQVENPFRVIKGKSPSWGTGTISGFRSGQDSTATGTNPYLVSNVHTPFNETKDKGSGWGSGLAGEFISGLRSKGEQVKEASKYLAEQVEKTFKAELGIHSPSKVMMSLGKFASIGIVKGLGAVDIKKFAEGQAGSLAAAFAGMGNVGGNISEWIRAAMMIAGVPDSWLGPLSVIAQKESGGNPRAQNNWDINAKRGIPSKGLTK